MIAADASLGAPLIEGLPYLRAEAVHAARHELARTLDDVLARRIPGKWLDARATAEAAEQTARLIAPELGWTDADIDRLVHEYRAGVAA